jgi:hypothetical protein
MLRPHRITPHKPKAPQPSDTNPLHGYKLGFCEWTQVMGLSAETARMRQWALDHFIVWIDERGIRHPAEVTRLCAKVRQEMRRLSLPIEKRDAQHDIKNREELTRQGGQTKVPCLKITGPQGSRWLYESGEIIGYLRGQFAPA